MTCILSMTHVLALCPMLCFSNGLSASAICAFTLDSIRESFNGQFLHQQSEGSQWLPVPEAEVPLYNGTRPGQVSSNKNTTSFCTSSQKVPSGCRYLKLRCPCITEHAEDR